MKYVTFRAFFRAKPKEPPTVTIESVTLHTTDDRKIDVPLVNNVTLQPGMQLVVDWEQRQHDELKRQY